MKLSLVLLSVLAIGASAQDNHVVRIRSAVMGPTVKGAPYSALETLENSQTLADGTHINNTTQTMVYRDSAGRMRRETPDSITIWDPVANVSYALDPKTQTARQMPLGLATAGPFLKVPPGANGQMMRFEYRAVGVSPEVAPPPGGGDGADLQATVSPMSAGATASATAVRDGKLQTFQTVIADRGRVFSSGGQDGPQVGGEAEVQAVAALLPHLADNVAFVAPGGLPTVLSLQGKMAPQTESLGKQTIEGVNAEGTRITSTIEAGQIGNDRPIQILTERWYSQDLETVVKMTHSDPRAGQESLQLTGIIRAEPAPDLFQLPPSYQLVNGR